jgi:lipopolysaccharide export system protein LptA
VTGSGVLVRCALAVLPALPALPAAALAQPTAGRQCAPAYEPLHPADSVPALLQRQPSGKYNVFQGGGVRYRCQNTAVVIDADSMAYYGDLAVVYMVGNVHYRDERAALDSELLTYYQNEEWVVAQGNVFARMDDGSTMRGPTAEYFRPIPATRPVARLSATGRPTLNLADTDSAGQPRPPVEVVADHITALGDSLVYAGGQVVITRPDLVARADSAELDDERELARLMRSPAIVGKGKRPFTLTGTLIDLFSHERQLQRVLAMGSARTVSEDVELRSDTLDMRLAANELDRAYAWGPARAVATSPGRDIVADSLDVRLSGQRLREVYAVGGARVESVPDTLHIRTDERDWLAGDTIVARFDTTVTPGDTASTPPLEQLVALGGARSYQHIAPDSGVTQRPSIHYVRGRDITVAFGGEPDDRQVERVDVTAPDSGLATGVYLDAGDRGATVQSAAPGAARPAAPVRRPTPPATPPPTPARTVPPEER